MAKNSGKERWYLADLVMESAMLGTTRNVVHVNLHLIRASSPELAYQKAVKLGRSGKSRYKNFVGDRIRVSFRGIQSLVAVKEQLEDGAEIAYTQHVDMPAKEIRQLVKSKRKLPIFGRTKTDYATRDFMSGAIVKRLYEAGCSEEQLFGKRRR